MTNDPEAEFRAYREASRREFIEAFHMRPVRVGIVRDPTALEVRRANRVLRRFGHIVRRVRQAFYGRHARYTKPRRRWLR